MALGALLGVQNFGAGDVRSIESITLPAWVVLEWWQAFNHPEWASHARDASDVQQFRAAIVPEALWMISGRSTIRISCTISVAGFQACRCYLSSMSGVRGFVDFRPFRLSFVWTAADVVMAPNQNSKSKARLSQQVACLHHAFKESWIADFSLRREERMFSSTNLKLRGWAKHERLLMM